MGPASDDGEKTRKRKRWQPGGGREGERSDGGPELGNPGFLLRRLLTAGRRSDSCGIASAPAVDVGPNLEGAGGDGGEHYAVECRSLINLRPPRRVHVSPQLNTAQMAACARSQLVRKSAAHRLVPEEAIFSWVDGRLGDICGKVAANRRSSFKADWPSAFCALSEIVEKGEKAVEVLAWSVVDGSVAAFAFWGKGGHE